MKALHRFAVVAALLGASVCFAYGRAAVAIRTNSTITVDGSLREWNPGLYGLAPAIALRANASTIEEGKIGDAADFSAEAFVAVKGRSLFVAALVTDDSVQFERQGDMWKGDMFEVLVSVGERDYLHVGINPAGDTFVFHAPAAKKGFPPAAVHGAARLEAPGYVVEIEIPFAAFGGLGTERSLHFNLAARDRDEGKDPAGHLTWSGVRHNLPASFGQLVVEDAPKVSATWPHCPAPSAKVSVEVPLVARGRELVAGTTPVQLRMVNYQSADASWPDFWTQWDISRVRRDLDLAAKLGINAVRLFVFTKEFGGAKPTPEMLSRLHAVVDEAARRGMVSVVSFFPFDKDFRPSRYVEMEAHLRAVVSSFRGDPAIAMWDLINEPDHMWFGANATVTPSDVSAWATKMAAAVRDADPTHLLTVGLAGHFAVDTGPVKEDESLPLVDVLSIHWYFDVKDIQRGFARAQTAMDKPLILQEFGASGLLHDEASASAHYRAICQAAKTAKLAGVAAWELFDHPVGTVAHFKPVWAEAEDNYFGLLRADGTPKKQAGAFCECLTVPSLKVARP